MEEYKNGKGYMFGMSYPALPTRRVIRQVCVCVFSHLRGTANNFATLIPIFPESRPVKKPSKWVAAEVDWQMNLTAMRKHS